MAIASPLVSQPIAQPVGERRVVFQNLNWQRYLLFRQAIGDHRAARLIYDRGVLEVTMPLEDHEFAVSNDRAIHSGAGG